jgi:hypothetical protein
MVDVRVLSEEESQNLTPGGVVLDGKEHRYVHSISRIGTVIDFSRPSPFRLLQLSQNPCSIGIIGKRQRCGAMGSIAWEVISSHEP